MTMRTALRLPVAVAILVTASLVASATARAETGEEMFNKICAACHTVGGGKRVGPDLAGVTDRRDREWLISFIKSSQAMIDAGDPIAVQLYEEYNKVPMPDPPFDKRQIGEIIDYIATASGSAPAAGAAAPLVPAREATPEEIATGGELFQGTIRFENGGPACNSCHDVKNDAVIGGGVLARDLTSVFSRMGGEGVGAILGSPPFPVMERAYKERPLTEGEVLALVAFLQDADKQKNFQEPRDYGRRRCSAASAASPA